MSWNGSFALASSPKVVFGSGKLAALPGLVQHWGKKVLLVTGGKSLPESARWPNLLAQLESAGIEWRQYTVSGEPSPMVVDRAVEQYREEGMEVVVGIGGGSVLDAAKAIAAMFCETVSVKRFLEGVGDRKPSGKTLPFIAVPTTAGTGSEATKNAVLSEVGEDGFKKSLRHEQYVPAVALIDPHLMLSCPTHISAYSGMDAFTQLLESYLSTQASWYTDALALDGLGCIADSLQRVVEQGEDLIAREKMAYAAYLSGLSLANAGLGTIHGFASSVGARIAIPHGALCGTLMGISNRLTVEKLQQEDIAWKKYEQVGRMFVTARGKSAEYYITGLLERIEEWIQSFELPRLSQFGLQMAEIPNIAAATSNKFNPVQLTEEERIFILQTRL
ncbi:MAG: iron-containing alcohol dehydrogenase [Saprospiraceae bacterium]|nr:iron-containing alcohol dehydrogenase [Saprospiraceae bacterium]